MLLFALYWLLNGIVSLIQFIPSVGPDMSYYIGVVYNMVDIPLILALFYFTTTSALLKKFTLITLPAYIAVEIISVGLQGLNYDALKLSMGVGVVLVMICIIWEIGKYLNEVIHPEEKKHMIYIYAALLFQYGTYIIIYIFDYYIANTNEKDTFLLYYISSFVAAFIACCGFWQGGLTKRIRYRRFIEEDFNQDFI